MNGDNGAIPNAVPPGWTDSVATGPIWLLHYRDGSTRVEHVCDRSGRNAGVIRCAPLLEDHAVDWSDTPTVTPSILCLDCGLHGWVTDGQWSAA